MKNVFGFRTLIVALIVLVAACSKNDSNSSLSTENTQTANNESVQDSNSDDIDDMSTTALNSNSSAGSRIATTSDDRFCAGTSIVFSDVTATSGTATITFDAGGCTDKRGNVRKGQIVVAWQDGKWWENGASYKITLNNYSINGISISGTRVITNTGFSLNSGAVSLTWNVYATHTFTWPDGSTATRLVNKTKTWVHTATEDTFTVKTGPSSVNAHAATGTNRYGKSYTVDITSDLTYLGSCVKSNKVYAPVSGIKVIVDTSKSKTLTVDYGSGACDTSFTVTVDGTTASLTVTNDSSN